jgi:KDO2-lipid IV(A) lauroyltransferase
MQAIIFYLALPFLYLLSLLPFPVFYLFSDFVYFMMYYVMGYRKEVVTANLKKSFPSKNDKEIRHIRKAFYHYLCDLFLETFKTLTITHSSALKHCRLSPGSKALFEKYHSERKSVIIVMGHFGNWEWAGNSFSMQCPQQLYVIYHPLTNKFFNGLIYRMRTRFGTKLIAMRDTYKDMVRLKDEVNATAFIADQTPAPESAYWTTFLNQDTPVFLGTEKIARKMNYPVVYASVRRVKRGYYEIVAETLFEEPRLTKDGEITEAHTRKLEQEIIAQPEIWLWSHRRWKHKRRQETGAGGNKGE